MGTYGRHVYARHVGHAIAFPGFAASRGTQLLHTLCMQGSPCGRSMGSKHTGHAGIMHCHVRAAAISYSRSKPLYVHRAARSAS